MVYLLKFDDEKAKVFESVPTKTDQFQGELQKVDIAKDKQKVVFEFDSKGV
jgi:hypothetical protein